MWLAVLGPFFFASYSFSNWFASQRGDVGTIVFEWERSIPFLAWTIVPYWSIDFFYACSLLLARTRTELDGHAKRLLTAQIISVSVFLAFPLRFAFERPETTGLFGSMFDVLLGFDRPFNQAPSLHISLLVILWTFYARHTTGVMLWVVRVIAVLIGVSVLTTYQHHFIDVPTGALVGAICILLFSLDAQDNLKQLDPRRFVLARRYLAGASAFGLVSMLLGGTWLWLFWPACSLATVAYIYWRGAPALFRKTRGRLDDAVAILLAPYWLAAWINSRWWTRKHAQPIEVTPDLWLSRLPGRAEFNWVKPNALVDCCAEVPVKHFDRPVFAVPMLDLLAPEAAQIDRGVAALTAARAHGKALVFCALGFSRSACIVVAWLVAQGIAANIDAAIAMLRKAQPNLVLSSAHIAQLESWHAKRIANQA